MLHEGRAKLTPKQEPAINTGTKALAPVVFDLYIIIIIIVHLRMQPDGYGAVIYIP